MALHDAAVPGGEKKKTRHRRVLPPERAGPGSPGLHRRQERTNALLTVTTVVHVHSRMGRIYMLPVTPMHKLIAPAAMKALASA